MAECFGHNFKVAGNLWVQKLWLSSSLALLQTFPPCPCLCTHHPLAVGRAREGAIIFLFPPLRTLWLCIQRTGDDYYLHVLSLKFCICFSSGLRKTVPLSIKASLLEGLEALGQAEAAGWQDRVHCTFYLLPVHGQPVSLWLCTNRQVKQHAFTENQSQRLSDY